MKATEDRFLSFLLSPSLFLSVLFFLFLCNRIYSLQRLREVGVLNTPSSGTITALALIEESFLLSGDSRGFLKLWRCSDWSLLRCMDTRKAQEESRLKKSGEGRGGRGLKRKKEKKSADDEDQDDGALVEGKFGIRSLAVHASSRLCFVLNEKNFLQLWNLMDGTCSAVTQLFGGRQPSGTSPTQLCPVVSRLSSVSQNLRSETLTDLQTRQMSA